MGKGSDKPMEGKTKPEQQGKKDQVRRINSNDDENIASFNRTISTPAPKNPHTFHLAASASSPSLLAGCADSNTHAGAVIQRHVHAHNVQVVTPSQNSSSNGTLSPIPVSPDDAFRGTPFVNDHIPAPSSSDIPPDSVFLTPASPRMRRSLAERPASAPSHHLEKISGTLLRLIGDHYSCSVCGRELRTLGDQLTMETTMNHIRRAISSGNLNVNENQN